MYESGYFCKRELDSLRKIRKSLTPPGDRRQGVYSWYRAVVKCPSSLCKSCFYSGKSSAAGPRRHCKILERALALRLVTEDEAVTTIGVVDKLISVSITNIIEGKWR